MKRFEEKNNEDARTVFYHYAFRNRKETNLLILNVRIKRIGKRSVGHVQGQEATV